MICGHSRVTWTEKFNLEPFRTKTNRFRLNSIWHSVSSIHVPSNYVRPFFPFVHFINRVIHRHLFKACQKLHARQINTPISHKQTTSPTHWLVSYFLPLQLISVIPCLYCGVSVCVESVLLFVLTVLKIQWFICAELPHSLQISLNTTKMCLWLTRVLVE